ncbi:hypothetical protein [Atlantic halibut reovirus]|nr:hypothetical protein [Atlantic halibut reovirus]
MEPQTLTPPNEIDDPTLSSCTSHLLDPTSSRDTCSTRHAQKRSKHETLIWMLSGMILLLVATLILVIHFLQITKYPMPDYIVTNSEDLDPDVASLSHHNRLMFKSYPPLWKGIVPETDQMGWMLIPRSPVLAFTPQQFVAPHLVTASGWIQGPLICVHLPFRPLFVVILPYQPVPYDFASVVRLMRSTSVSSYHLFDLQLEQSLLGSPEFSFTSQKGTSTSLPQPSSTNESGIHLRSSPTHEPDALHAPSTGWPTTEVPSPTSNLTETMDS